MIRFPLTHRVAALAGLAALLPGGYAAPQQLIASRAENAGTAATCPAPTGILALTFSHEFAGVSPADHYSNVWTGRLGGAVNGDLVMTLELLGSPAEAASPVWQVRTRWAVTGGTEFTADLYGTVDWKSGAMGLVGVIGEGCLAGSVMRAEGRFIDLDGSGTIQILPPPAL